MKTSLKLFFVIIAMAGSFECVGQTTASNVEATTTNTPQSHHKKHDKKVYQAKKNGVTSRGQTRDTMAGGQRDGTNGVPVDTTAVVTPGLIGASAANSVAASTAVSAAASK